MLPYQNSLSRGVSNLLGTTLVCEAYYQRMDKGLFGRSPFTDELGWVTQDAFYLPKRELIAPFL